MTLAIVRGEHASIPPDRDPSNPEYVRRLLLEHLQAAPAEELSIGLLVTLGVDGTTKRLRCVATRPTDDASVAGMLAIMQSQVIAGEPWEQPTPETGPEKPEEPA